MKETILKKIEGLSDSQLAELSSYIDFLGYKARAADPKTPQNLLKHFNPLEVPNWKYLASAVRSSGIAESGAGYMDRRTVINWVSLNYGVDREVATDAIGVLTDSGLLDSSSYGNLS